MYPAMASDNSLLDRMATSVSRVSTAAAKAGASSSGTSSAKSASSKLRVVSRCSRPSRMRNSAARPPRDLVQLLDQFPARRLGRAIGLLNPGFERFLMLFVQTRCERSDGLFQHPLHAFRPLRFQHIPNALDM